MESFAGHVCPTAKSFVVFEVAELDEEMGHMIEALHEVEADFENLCRQHSQILERSVPWIDEVMGGASLKGGMMLEVFLFWVNTFAAMERHCHSLIIFFRTRGTR